MVDIVDCSASSLVRLTADYWLARRLTIVEFAILVMMLLILAMAVFMKLRLRLLLLLLLLLFLVWIGVS